MARERQQKYFEKDWIRNKENISIYFAYNSHKRKAIVIVGSVCPFVCPSLIPL